MNTGLVAECHGAAGRPANTQGRCPMGAITGCQCPRAPPTLSATGGQVTLSAHLDIGFKGEDRQMEPIS